MRLRLGPHLRWPLAVVALLAAGVGAHGYLLYRATSSSSFAIEPDYYRKAVEFDQEAARRRHSLDLGWRVAVGQEEDKVYLALRDRSGHPIEGASVIVRAYHFAHGRDRRAKTLGELGGGRYGWLPIDRPGWWDIALEVRRGADLFVDELRWERPGGGS